MFVSTKDTLRKNKFNSLSHLISFESLQENNKYTTVYLFSLQKVHLHVSIIFILNSNFLYIVYGEIFILE